VWEKKVCRTGKSQYLVTMILYTHVSNNVKYNIVDSLFENYKNIQNIFYILTHRSSEVVL